MPPTDHVHDDHAHDHADDTAAAPDAPPAFVERVLAVLAERGPLAVGELAAAVRAAAPELVDALDDVDLRAALRAVGNRDERLWTLGDGRIGCFEGSFDGVVFTHRVTADELRREVLDGTPDLVGLPERDELPLAGGANVEVRFGDERAHADGSLVGPVGWLAGIAAGDLVAVRWREADGLTVEVVDAAAVDAAATERHAALLRAVFDARPTAAVPPEPYELVRDALVADRDAFRGSLGAPVGELFAQVGLERRGDWLVVPGDADGDERAIARARLVDQAVSTDGLRACCATALRSAFEAWGSWLGDPAAGIGTEDEARRAVDALDHGPVVVLLHQTVVLGGEDADQLVAWSAELGRAIAPTVSAGVAYLEARAADAAGDPEAALERLEAGLAAQPGHVGVQLLLADLLEDRGEIVRPLQLLRGAGVPGNEPRLAALAGYVAAARTTGRNDPCPCGSGRKFKACCSARGAVVTPAQRARWLLLRAFRATAEGEEALPLVNLRGRLERTVATPLVSAVLADLQLFERGGLAAYLEGRGRLLPDADRALVARWIGEPLRVLEVVTAGAGRQVLADRGDGTRFDVALEATPGPERGSAVLARLLPVDVDATLHVVTGAALAVLPDDVERMAAAVRGGPLGADGLIDLLASRAPVGAGER